MVVKRINDSKAGSEEERENKVSESSKNPRRRVEYSFPDPIKTKVWGAPKVDFKPFEARALAEITNVIEKDGSIRADIADGIFKRHAEADHAIPREGRLNHILGRYVNTGRLIKTEKTQRGEVTTDSSVLVPKVRFMKGNKAEYWEFVIELQKMFKMSDEKARDVAAAYSPKKREALRLLRSLMQEVSFEGLDILLHYSKDKDCSRLVKRPLELKRFLDRVQANMVISLSGALQRVSGERLKDFISKTPLNELPELVRIIKQRTEEVRKFDDEEFARFRLREERLIAARKSKA